MFNWIKQFNEASYQTKLFFFIAAIFAIALAVTTIYSYARLDFVRSYKTVSNERQS